MSEFFELASPERVTVGTVGPLGQRVFYLQARAAATLITLKLEKQQVGALAQTLGRLLQDLARPGELPGEELLGLEDFDDVDFAVGALAVAYDATSDRVVLLAEELAAGGEDEAVEAGTGESGEEAATGSEARLALTREQAAALAIRGTALVESGRPPCPLCGFPLDARGHVCPRTNGHEPPIP